MKTIRLSAIPLVLAAIAANASPLTPLQALQRISDTRPAALKAKASAESMKLVHTINASSGGAPTLYVFNAPDAEGFVVTAADDAAGTILLGYSDQSAFDPANIPPSMLWWLNNASTWVAQAAANPAAPARQAAVRSSAKTPISPLCSTKWNQGDPYNMYCPVVDGERSVTGCMATAMAQAMKVHEWPITGQGSIRVSYNGGSTVDFGATTYAWSQMRDSYVSSATSAQKDAVATLMYHCGVASDMNYSPKGSGANNVTAGIGLINNFRYNPAMLYLARDWYTQDDWDDLVYEEIRAGRPVVYCGDDGTSGHAFVADGYSSGGYFHINWGWAGSSDGYFLLSDLNPYSQGIGGGSGEDGFNYNQSIWWHMEPNHSSAASPSPNMAFYGVFVPVKRLYNRMDNEFFEIAGSAYSYAFGTLDYTTGFELVASNGSKTYLQSFSITLDPLYGFSKWSFPTGQLPVGSYDVYPVCKSADSDWVRIHHQPEVCSGYFHIEVSDYVVTVSGDTPLPRAWFTFDDGEDLTDPDVDEFVAGHQYKIVTSVETNYAIDANIALTITDSKKTIVAQSDKRRVSIPFADGGYMQYEWIITIPASLSEGEYTFALTQFNADGTTENLVGAQKLTISEDPAFGKASFQGVVFVDSPNRGLSSSSPATLGRGYGKANMHFECSAGPWSEEVYGSFYDIDGETLQFTSASSPLTLETGASGFATITGFSQARIGEVYRFVPSTVRQGDVESKRKYYVTFIDDAGVDDPIADPLNAPVRYYNLQGVRVDNPQPGQLLIRTQGPSATLVKIP